MRFFVPGLTNYWRLLAASYVGIAPLVAAAVPSILSGLFGMFSGGSKRKAEQQAADAAYAEKMRLWDQKASNAKSSRAILAGLAKNYGADSLLPAGFLDTFTNYNPMRPAKGADVPGSALGDFMGSAGPTFAKAVMTPRPQAELAGQTFTGAGAGGGGKSPIDDGLSGMFSKSGSGGLAMPMLGDLAKGGVPAPAAAPGAAPSPLAGLPPNLLELLK